MSHIANPTRADLDLDLISEALENEMVDIESDHFCTTDDEFDRGLVLAYLQEQLELICTIQNQEENSEELK